jgi:DNA repair exonuclease SbcCD ATPase subunit|uniref:Dynein regulatory complex protein 10 n=1 Tax=Eutreptiella gymnastica TaxID=73025 RepID=A0A7S4D2I8_9EUGL|mmetsp:Transcript_73050/g.123103  ORF Transcript_73050/g.123103 Transcript_73050/m.123103 type:complete len:362 (+) Transcript_73050:101-1186(+)|eukprot:CAMPEP_0174281716 /NCGR_PEP_ID=MMETSP0809-20121228/2106_1 /TAXON_ID=73025 ORGANISM="Eutreptiella gymnastica-like, Strain CCMP1594" /NCGR_SAMPLE_ID=MMETSP0809 /ASSEMBLY_ACC=CAM_ASM_000658 /LENGTH=361 /DNA_ID=CAMNT_0015375429 /DNA_START=101 /DNA_END=1186 /DNA_ORIENTATION=+
MNQQTVLESKRILAIIDDLLNDLTTLQCVPAFLSQFQPADLAYLGPDIQGRLSELLDTERKLEQGQGVGNEELSFAHKHSVRAVLDMLRQVQYTDGYEPATSPDEGLMRFHLIIKTLRGLMHDKFNTTVEEDLQKFEILRDTVSREQTASADVKALNREFQSERNLRKVEVARRDEAIKKLSDELQTIQESAVEEDKEFERQVKDAEEINVQTYQQEEERLQSLVEQLEANLAKAEEANNKEEAALRQERRKREQFLDGLLTQYDTEMNEKTSEFEQYQQDYARDQIKLEQLEKDLKQFDEDQAKRDAEEKIENDRKLHHMEVLVRMDTSSKLLQAFWRGYAIRLMIKKKKTGKKKGGKKK